MKIIMSVLLSLFFLGCTTHHETLKTVEKVDLKRYLGTWFEIARYDQFFERGCSNISATYSLMKDEHIKVVNRCTKEDGEKKQAQGVAYATDDSYSKLKVSFFRPFYGDYQIIMLDDAYTYAVIGEPSRKYFWILSRKKYLDEKIKQMILKKMPSLGYDPSQLIWPTHE